MEISNDSHHHKLVLKSANHPFYCQKCDQLGFGPSYSCNKSEYCNFFLHEQCGNPESQVKYPFSTKCVLKFRTQAYGQDSLCVVCAKKIKGYHYNCMCTFVKRNVHPYCLSYEQTIEAVDGLTLHLKKEATTKCLHCDNKNLRSRVHGWAYVSSCGNYCYHVSCVMEIINDGWRNGFFTGKSNPFQTVKQRFPADMDRRRQVVAGRKEKPTSKKVVTILSAMCNVFTGNPSGLVGDAKYYFG